MQFNDVKQSKTRWRDLEIKFIKGKNFKENREVQNNKVGGNKMHLHCSFLSQITQFTPVFELAVQRLLTEGETPPFFAKPHLFNPLIILY